MALRGPSLAGMSSSTTGNPALARCAAMREPMVPAPSTAALRITVKGARSGDDAPAAAGLMADSTLMRIAPFKDYAQLVARLPGGQPLCQGMGELTGNLVRRQGAVRF